MCEWLNGWCWDQIIRPTFDLRQSPNQRFNVWPERLNCRLSGVILGPHLWFSWTGNVKSSQQLDRPMVGKYGMFVVYGRLQRAQVKVQNKFDRTTFKLASACPLGIKSFVCLSVRKFHKSFFISDTSCLLFVVHDILADTWAQTVQNLLRMRNLRRVKYNSANQLDYQ